MRFAKTRAIWRMRKDAGKKLRSELAAEKNRKTRHVIPVADWNSYKIKFTHLPPPSFKKPPCDICGIVEDFRAGHSHSDWQKFVRNLKFWR